MKNIFLFAGTWLFVSIACSHNNDSGGGNTNPGNAPTLNYWLTKSDGSILLQPQQSLAFDSKTNNYSFIDVDSTKPLQTIDGFGYTLTGGSAFVINHMSNSAANELLTELFGTANNSIGISYLRLSIGASDLNASVFSYDDMPAGQTDLSLTHFSLAADTVDLIPILKKNIVA